MNDTEGLPEFLHTAQVSIVAIAVDADGDIKLDLVVGIVRLALSDIPWDTRPSQHDATKGEVEGLGGRNDTDALQPLEPNSVVCKHLFGFVDTITKLGSPLVDVVEETNGNILVNTARSNVGGVETGSGDTFVELLHLGGWILAFALRLEVGVC